ncbi:MAG: YebC/PmpR family DNA-binding transcriptional regulator [Patescibacteria group bacterium]
MSGHSKWATTHRQKSAQDAKRGAIFTKLANLITIATKEGGSDTNSNFKLRLAIDKAREANMPKDNIERAISRGAGLTSGDSALEEVTYEIFGPGGSAFIVEAITDNKNRTVAQLKNILNKNGGQLGAPNSVLWMFERCGLLVVGLDQLSNKKPDELELQFIDLGALDITKNDADWEIYTASQELLKINEALKKLGINPAESGLVYAPKDKLIVSDSEMQNKISQLYDALSDYDEISNVYTNASW